jgi:hypothetical protein
MTAKRFVDRGFWFGVIPKLECIRSYRFPVMNKKPRCQDVVLIYRCIQCLPWHCQSVLILWHFDCSLDFFNFSLRGTMIHPKKPAFFRPIKSFIFLKYLPRLHLLPSRISKFSAGGPPHQSKGGTPPSRTHPFSRLWCSGTCLWHVQFPPTSKNSPSTLKLFENPDNIDIFSVIL